MKRVLKRFYVENEGFYLTEVEAKKQNIDMQKAYKFFRKLGYNPSLSDYGLSLNCQISEFENDDNEEFEELTCSCSKTDFEIYIDSSKYTIGGSYELVLKCWHCDNEKSLKLHSSVSYKELYF